MRKIACILAGSLISFGTFAQKNTSTAPSMPVLKTAKDTASYAYGIVLGNSLKRQMNASEIDQELVTKAVTAALANDPLPFTQEDAQRIYADYQKAASLKQHESTIKDGEAFLANNKKRKEVTTTASGLQYEVLKSGDPNAAMPKATDRVKVHYHGTLIDGSVFDSSIERGTPAEFPLNGVIKGWTEGLQYMHVGDKFKLFLPYNLAYGERAAGAKIKPYSALVFEVELLEITSAK